MDGHSVEPGRHYDRVTEAWRLIFGDQLHYGVFERADDDLATATDRLTDLMIEAARLTATSGPVDLLDIGSGTGVVACRIAEQYGARVLGITTSSVGVETGRLNAAAQGLAERVRFEQRDGTRTDLPDATFDVAWALESSHLMRQRERLLSECARVLRPGGRVALCDIMLRRELAFAEVKALRKELALLRDVFGDAHMERMQRYVEWLQPLGVDVDVATDLTAQTRPTFAAWRANIDTHETAITELIGAPSMSQFRDSTYVLESLWDDGVMGYGLVGGTRAAQP
ncbi:MAG TPA: methyltransferase domain-containing protein [Mycobacteriales bacterium]|nr:methyltransferase domain-containing protein [Mycobacteriales bacterium]